MNMIGTVPAITKALSSKEYRQISRQTLIQCLRAVIAMWGPEVDQVGAPN